MIPGALPGVILECRAKNKPCTLLGVAPRPTFRKPQKITKESDYFIEELQEFSIMDISSLLDIIISKYTSILKVVFLSMIFFLC